MSDSNANTTPKSDATPGSWADVDHDSVRFQALLHKYDDDYQLATDAYLRGEDADPGEAGVSPNPM